MQDTSEQKDLHNSYKLKKKGDFCVAFLIGRTTFRCCFSINTRASQHLFVAQQAVLWADVIGRESAITSILDLQPFQCSGQNRLHGPKSPPPPTSALQPCARAAVSWEIWGWAHVSGQGRTPRSGSKGGWRACRGSDGQWRWLFVWSESLKRDRFLWTPAEKLLYFLERFILGFWKGLTAPWVLKPDYLIQDHVL